MRGAECHMRCAGRNSKKVIQKEPTAGYSPKAKGFTERHNLTLLVMLADSAAAPFCLPSLGAQHAADAIIYANDLHNTTPAANAMVCSAPHEGLLKRAVKLSVDRKFGCPVGIHSPGRLHAHRQKLSHCGVPGRFLRVGRPFDCSIVRMHAPR